MCSYHQNHNTYYSYNTAPSAIMESHDVILYVKQIEKELTRINSWKSRCWRCWAVCTWWTIYGIERKCLLWWSTVLQWCPTILQRVNIRKCWSHSWNLGEIAYRKSLIFWNLAKQKIMSGTKKQHFEETQRTLRDKLTFPVSFMNISFNACLR